MAGGHNKKTTEQHIAELKIRNCPLTVLGEYNGAGVKLLYQCACGTEFERPPTDVLSGKWRCTSCRHKSSAATKNKSYGTKYDAKLAVNNPRYERTGEYVDGYTPLRHRCKDHGTEFEIPPNQILNKQNAGGLQRCKPCHRERIVSVRAGSRWDLTTFDTDQYWHVRTIENEVGGILEVVMRCKDHGRYRTQPSGVTDSKYAGCLRCARLHAGSVKTKTVHRAGRVWKLQGYEEFGLDVLLANYPVAQIKCSLDDKTSPIRYRFGGADRRYYPDFVVAGYVNIEVKSTYTLAPNRRDWRRNKAKFRAAELAGGFQLLVFDPTGRKLPVPNNLLDLTYRQVQAFYKSIGV